MRYLKRIGIGSCWVLPAAVLAAAGCGQGVDPVGTDLEPLPADQVLIDVVHTPTMNGVRSAIGRYDTVYVFEDSSKMHLKGVNLELFDATGRQTATVVAQSGELNQATEAMVARGSVRLVVREDGRVIETEELYYDPSSKRIWSEVATTMRHEGRVTNADGFSADDGFNVIEYQRPRGQLPGVRVQF